MTVTETSTDTRPRAEGGVSREGALSPAWRKGGNLNRGTGRPRGARRAGRTPAERARHRQRRAQRLLQLREKGAPFYGALDLGTNNCRLLIARPTADGGFRVIDAFSRIVRLGEGISRTGRLSEEAQARTLAALRICANKLRFWNVRRMRLIATQACRRAENGEQFLARVRHELGLSLEVIDAETEARLAVMGACPLIDREARHVLVFDIGGGSTELLWVERHDDGARTVRDWMSLPEGVVTLSERFGGEEVSPEAYAAMRAHVRGRLADFAARLRAHGLPPQPCHLLGTSGTVTTITGVALGLARYDRGRVDGSWLSRTQVHEISARLRAMSLAERRAEGCIGADRADLVVAGCAILEEIIATWPVERIRVADRGLREGMLTRLMEEDGHAGPAQT